MKLRKRYGRPLPFIEIEWDRKCGRRATPRRRYIATAQGYGGEYVLHATKGWRRFSLRQAERVEQ